MNGYKRINNNSLSQKESLGNVTAKTITTDTLNATTFLGQPSIWYTGLHGSIQSQFIELQFNYQGMFRVLNNVRNDYFRKSDIIPYDDYLNTLSGEIYNVQTQINEIDDGFFTVNTSGSGDVSQHNGYSFFNNTDNNTPTSYPITVNCYLDSISITGYGATYFPYIIHFIVNNTTFYIITFEVTPDGVAAVFNVRNTGLPMITRGSTINLQNLSDSFTDGSTLNISMVFSFTNKTDIINLQTTTGTLQSEINNIYNTFPNYNDIFTLSGSIYNIYNTFPNYNDIFTLSGSIYNIYNTFPNYNDIFTLSGSIYNINTNKGGFFNIYTEGVFYAANFGGFNYFYSGTSSVQTCPVLGCDCYLDFIGIVSIAALTQSATADILIDGEVFYTMVVPPGSRYNNIDLRGQGYFIPRGSILNIRTTSGDSMHTGGRNSITLTFSSGGVIGPVGPQGPAGVDGLGYDYILNNFLTLSGLYLTTTQPQIQLPPGSNPTVEITKQIINNNAYFDLLFSIPNGYNGTNGGNGSDGSNGRDGKDGKNGSNGSNGSNGGSATADPVAIIALIIATFGIAALTAGELSLQAQIIALGLKTLNLVCIPGTSAILGGTPTVQINAAVVLDLYSRVICRIGSEAQIIIKSELETNLGSTNKCSVNGFNTFISGTNSLNIASNKNIDIVAPNINLIGNVSYSMGNPYATETALSEFKVASRITQINSSPQWARTNEIISGIQNIYV